MVIEQGKYSQTFVARHDKHLLSSISYVLRALILRNTSCRTGSAIDGRHSTCANGCPRFVLSYDLIESRTWRRTAQQSLVDPLYRLARCRSARKRRKLLSATRRKQRTTSTTSSSEPDSFLVGRRRCIKPARSVNSPALFSARSTTQSDASQCHLTDSSQAGSTCLSFNPWRSTTDTYNRRDWQTHNRNRRTLFWCPLTANNQYWYYWCKCDNE